MLKKASNKVEVLDLDGTKIHAIRADKGIYDDYADVLFDRNDKGELVVKSGRAIQEVYAKCVKKIENCMIDNVVVAEINDTQKIVEFLTHLDDPITGKKIDNWLLGLSTLEPIEIKN
jgi:hypothetical protein